MKRNDLNAIITGIVHRYIEDGWVLEMDNASYSDVVGVHFLSRGRERVAVGIRRPELKEVTESGRYANLRGLDSRILFESRAPNYDVTRSPFFAFDMKGECREVEHQTRIHVPEGSWGEYQFNVN